MGRDTMDNNSEAMNMSYELLKNITDGFSDERVLGRGTFGVVYKGVDKDGNKIAVKLLKSMQGVDDKEFLKEFNNLTKLKHENIVPFVGFCNEAERVPMEYEGKNIIAHEMHRALCFEYMKNGSLQKHLYEEHQGFDWQRRYKIIKGICEGLKHLHTGLEGPVYHLDLKPDNILLDDNMVPKIADFGLSRLIGEKNTKKTINPVGTLGYCPPEFMNYQLISPKFDIFSLGVIIIKIMCGTAGYSLFDDKKSGRFIKNVHQNWKERLGAIQGYASLDRDCQQVKKCLKIALQCIDKERDRRPNIEYVINQLNETEKDTNGTTYGMEQVESLKFSYPGMPTHSSLRKSQERKHDSWTKLPKEIPANFLKQITEEFSEQRMLSKPVHGAVYRGTLPDGDEILVKKLGDNWSIHQKTFYTEINNLMAVEHENIVKLIGYSHETQKKVIDYSGRFIIVDETECFLCYEYLPKGSLDNYLVANQSTIDWDTRFKIIKGICQGLHFLHKGLADGPLVHMSLQPTSIWLDDDWVPKIADFGLSRLFGKEQTRHETMNIMGTKGYMAPEYLYRGEISTMSDVYSLGALIIQVIATGGKECTIDCRTWANDFMENARQNRKSDDQITSKYPALDADVLQQVKACIEIGLQCMEPDRNNRPSIVDIIKKISEVDGSKRHSLVENFNMDNKSLQIKPVSTELIDIYPVQLRFPFKPNKLISCSLRLTNTTDDCVGIRLATTNRRMYMARMPLCCLVPPRSTYNLIVTTAERKKPSLESVDDILTLESSIVRDSDLNIKSANLAIEYDHLFEKAIEQNTKQVYQLTSKVVLDPVETITSIQPQIEIKSDKQFSQVLFVDVHPTEPWIMTCHHAGDIIIWDYLTQEIDGSFEITKKPMYAAKFIVREKWFVAGDGDGTLYVYSYYTEEEVRNIEMAHRGDIKSLDVHPTGSFVLSSSDDRLIKLWDWKNSWECIQTFEGHNSTVTRVSFNQLDPDCFFSVSLDQTVKIWSISSPGCRVTLIDHPDRLMCVHSFTSAIQRYLLTGSMDGTVQVWDSETEKCVQKLTGHTNCISSVCSHPELPIVMTGSYDGTVRLWNSTTYRLENIIGVNLGAVNTIGYIQGFKRIVVGCDQGMAIMDIDFP